MKIYLNHAQEFKNVIKWVVKKNPGDPMIEKDIQAKIEK